MATDKPAAGKRSGNGSNGSGSEPELASTSRAVGMVAQGRGHSEQTSGDNGGPPAAGPHHKPLFTQHRSPQAQMTSQSSDSPSRTDSLIEMTHESMLFPIEAFKQEWQKTDKVVLKLRDGVELIESRSHLASVSEFFRVLFSHSFVDSKSEAVQLYHLPPQDVMHCMFYLKCVSGMDISLREAVSLLETAAFLQLQPVIELFSNTILDRITPNDILDVYRLSLAHGLSLASDLWDLVIKNFHKFIHNHNHLKMTEVELMKALNDTRLAIDTKYEMVIAEGYVMAHPDASELRKFTNNHRMRRIRKGSTADDVSYPVFQQRIPRMTLISVGGWSATGVTGKVEVYNPRSENWSQCKLQSFVAPEFAYSPRAYQGIVISGEKRIIMAGGFNGTDFYQDTYLYDFHTRMWSRGCNLHTKRNYACLATIRESDGAEFALVCGGRGPRTQNRAHSHTRLNSSEIYDVSQNMWLLGPNMNCMRSDGGACSLYGEKQVIAVGGFDGQNVHDTCEVYDPTANRWYPLSCRMHAVRTGNSCVEIVPGVVLTCGGFDKSARIRQAEMLDLRECRWHNLPDMTYARSNYGMVSFEQNTYVAGGFDGEAICAHLETFDFRAFKWINLKPLLEPKSALRLLAVSNADTSFIRDLCGFEHNF